MGPKFSQMIILKISYNHKSHLIRTPGYLIRFPNYQNTNVSQTSCKSEGKKKKDWQACCLILSLPAAALWWADSWAVPLFTWRTVTGDKVMGSPVDPARGQRQTRQPHFWTNRALTDSCRWHVFSSTSSSLKTQCLQNAFWIHIQRQNLSPFLCFYQRNKHSRNCTAGTGETNPNSPTFSATLHGDLKIVFQKLNGAVWAQMTII